MSNEDEFFGLAAAVRKRTHAVSIRHPWMKYVLAILILATLGAAAIIGGTLFWAAAFAYIVLGFIWFQFFSNWRDFWWGRKRGSNFFNRTYHLVGAIVVVLAASATWPMWMAGGEDMFD